MRERARVDANQAEIVKSLRSVGATVKHCHQLGKGWPDIMVGYRGKNYLFEIKDGSKPPSKQKLTPDEQEWHDGWLGYVRVVHNAGEAVAVVLEEELRETATQSVG